MSIAERHPRAIELDILKHEIDTLLPQLGEGKVLGVAYDTAWVARLAPRFPQAGFDACLEWLRENQHEDGSWGAPLLHYHDRFISTLAAVVALREAGRDPKDAQRVKQGEHALWQIVGRLGRDDSDTVGFPILSAALAEDALRLGLDVPLPPLRFAEPYRKKVNALLNQPARTWTNSPVVFSLEALRQSIQRSDSVLAANHSVGISPAATAGYLLEFEDDKALGFLKTLLDRDGTGAIPALSPIDIFENAWAMLHLSSAGAIDPADPKVIRVLDMLNASYTSGTGVSYSNFFGVQDADDTAAVYAALRWGGYTPSAAIFELFEAQDYFYCYHGETNPSTSAQVRLLQALRHAHDHPARDRWLLKILNYLCQIDTNGSFWWDKWHASPYYVNSAAISALHELDDDLMRARLKWILRTQNPDGGWGYLGESTQEETAYCLSALMYVDREIGCVDPTVLDRAALFLCNHLHDTHYTALWIGKSLYAPQRVVQAAVLGALYAYSL